MPVSRRELLKLGILAAPGMSLADLAEAQISDPGSPPVVPFVRPLPLLTTISPNATPNSDDYDMTMRPGTASIIPGRPTPIWGYSATSGSTGLFPGPVIRARQGRTVNVRHRNGLLEPMSVHLHGGHVAPQHDGHPNALIAPGGLRDFVYPNNQPSATLWYHDHAVDLTGPHVYMGLAGFYLLGSTAEDALNLPSGQHDVPVMIMDRLFNRDGSMAYPLTDDALFRGILGDRILLNGAIQPFFQVTRRKWRFRLLNASNARTYDLSLSNGQPFIQIGSDGGLLGAPVNRTVIRLGPAERVDVVIDFSSVPQGTQIFLRNTNRMIPTRLDRAPRELMRFDVGSNATDTSTVPPVLIPVTPLGASARTVSFTLTQGVANGRRAWFINGALFDPTAPPMATPRLGEIETWEFVNNSNVSHPMHIHLVQFQIQDIGGVPPAPGDNGWKDTVNIPPGAVARVKAQFTGFTGTYVFHCHVLEHEDHAMMAQFRVDP